MSAKHNPPAGSMLAKLVDRMAEMSRDMSGLDSDDPDIRELMTLTLLRAEPRAWKLPLHIFRDNRLLPTIEACDGPEVADAFRKAPHALDDYARLAAEEIRRGTPEHERRAPKVDKTWMVEVIVLAALFLNYDVSKSRNWNFERTGSALGIDRNAVRRIFAAKGHRVLRSEEAMMALLFGVAQMVLPEELLGSRFRECLYLRSTPGSSISAGSLEARHARGV